MVRVQRPADCQGGPDDCEPPRSSTTCFPSLVSYVVRVPPGHDAQGCRRFWHSYGSANCGCALKMCREMGGSAQSHRVPSGILATP